MSKKTLVSYLLAQNTSISAAQVLVCLMCAVLLSLFMYFIYKKTYTGVTYSKNFNVTLVLIAVITTVVMLCIGSNLALSLGMVGSLSIIRFRTAIKEPRDIAFLFWAICIGLACGASMYLIAAMGSVVLAVLLVAFNRGVCDSSAYLLVLHSDSIEFDAQRAEEILGEQVGKFRLRMQNTSPAGVEITWEISSSKKGFSAASLIRELGALDSVGTVNLVAYSGEIIG